MINYELVLVLRDKGLAKFSPVHEISAVCMGSMQNQNRKEFD